MASLVYFTATGTYLAALHDSVYDVDNDPELTPMSGSVTFTPLIDTGDSLPAPTLSPPANVWLVPIKAQVKQGVITSNGSTGIKLVANTAVLGLSGNLYYRVDFYDGLTAGGKTYHPDSFTFQAPVNATTVDLVTVTPLPGHPAFADVLPVASVAGKTGAIILVADDVSNASTVGKAVLTAADAAAARNAIGATTTGDITTAVNGLLNGAPGALDTLKELADALGDDANFATTVTTALATKMRGSVYDSTGTLQPNKTVHVVLDANGDIDDIVII